MLRYRRQALVEDEAQAAMISTDDEAAPPQVRPPVAHRLDKPDELAFIGGELSVTRRDGLAEEGEGPGALVKNGAEIGAQCIALDDEFPVKIL